jgi:hypothetical protein
MKYVDFKIDNDTIEFHNSIFGKESICCVQPISATHLLFRTSIGLL